MKIALAAPAIDRDGDGVFDREDMYPTVSAGANPDLTGGCPLPDRDGDGVLDPADRALTWPQVPSPIRRESAARLPIAMATACWMPAISAPGT